MSRRLLNSAIGVTALALTALLAYSLERTAWLFGQFETWQEAAYAAAGVVELAAVALIVGASALAGLAPAARAWANRALLAVLSVGALANLSAGYLRGGAATLAAFGGDWAAYAVAAALWLCTNLAVPGLILCLSKLLEQLIAARVSLPATAAQGADRPVAIVLQPRAAALAQHEETSAETLYETVSTDRVAGNTSNTPASDYSCRYCGAAGLTKSAQLAHGRRRKRSGQCRA
jgi:hypothetical protein